MVEKEVELSLGEIKVLYEYFIEQYKKEGITVAWSKLILNNLKMLTTPYKQIYSGLYDENRDNKYIEYGNKLKTLIKKYVDLDEQGNPIIENGEPRITENIVEYQKEVKKLDEEYKDLVDRLDHKNEINNKFLSQVVKIKIYKVSEQEIPNSIPPYIIGFLLDE